MDQVKKTPTIQDVARHANVSSATVSRALSTPERVSEATRSRVEEAVAITGYTINQAARSLRSRAAKTILIALPNIGNPFYSTILDAAINEAASRGFGVLVANRLGHDPTEWLKDYFFSSRADGLLLFDSSLDLEALHDLPFNGGTLPLVLSSDEIPHSNFNLVMTDNFEASERATQHLIDLGHTRIGHVRTRMMKGLTNQRLEGYRSALARSGLEYRDEWVFPGDFSIASGVVAAERYLALTERPTAIFAANDEMAMSFLSRLQMVELECPRDVSIVGFDDISLAEHFRPRLTTMRQPRHQMGKAATAMLLDLLTGDQPPSETRKVILPSDLVIRGSTARVPL
jgi:LacI family repressor for deo operon, udp, cdd, tsx, nupC, and nupG